MCMGRPMLSYGIAKCTHRAVHTLSVNIAVFVRFPSLSICNFWYSLSLSLPPSPSQRFQQKLKASRWPSSAASWSASSVICLCHLCGNLETSTTIHNGGESLLSWYYLVYSSIMVRIVQISCPSCPSCPFFDTF